MGKPAHSRLTFSGDITGAAGTVEHWSFGVNLPVGYPGPAAVDADADAIATALKGVYETTLKPIMGSDIVLRRVVAAAQQAAPAGVARRVDGSFVQGVWEGSVAGDKAKQPMPPQTALVVSLGTDRAGATGKGRIFLPWPGSSLYAEDKLLTVAGANEIIDAVEAFLGLISTYWARPQVVSSKGYMSEVKRLRVGRAADTLRSRRRDVSEAYVSKDLVP